MYSSLLVFAGIVTLAQASVLGGPHAARHRAHAVAARQESTDAAPPTTDLPASSSNPAPTVGPPPEATPEPPSEPSLPPPPVEQTGQPAEPTANPPPPDANSSGLVSAPASELASSSLPFTYESGKPTMTVSSYAPGSTGPIAGAPVLPEAFVFRAGEWPQQDRVPPTDSAEVQAWMKELEGHDIPDFSPTVDGSCASDPVALAESATRGWWTCGGHVRDTDIVACPDRLTWGVSFDDGPGPYTPTLLNFLQERDLSATFFVVGSRVIERPTILVAEYMAGHEISVHTWSHSKPLTSMTNEEIVAELGWTRKSIKQVLGVTPTTMRPPWGDIDDRVRAISLAMGLIPIMWTRTPSGQTFDTNDWMVPGGTVNVEESIDTFEGILESASALDTGFAFPSVLDQFVSMNYFGSFIVLQHDVHEVTVDMAIDKTLNIAMAFQPQLTLQPIGQCVKYPSTNLYRESNTNETFPYPATSETVDIDGDAVPDVQQAANTVNGAIGSAAVPHTMKFIVSAVGFGILSALALC